MQLTGAEIVIRCLGEEGVEYVFGYPGGAVLNIYDEFFKQEKVKHVLVRHEQGAVHAADGYSRSSHKVGVALVTSGPGVTNAVTGIATAYMDSIPMVVLTGQVPTPRHRPGCLPGVRRGRHHAALRQAQFPGQGRQGPRGHDQEGLLPRRDRPAGPGAGRHSQGRHAGDDRVQLPEDRVAALVQPGDQGPRRARSRRRCSCCSRRSGPMIYAGGGVILDNAAPQLTRLVRLLGYPVHQHADGAGRVPRHRPAVHRHAGHARHLRIQHGDAALRRADGGRRALRRPRHRQPEALLPLRPQDHPHRHRPVVDLEARAGRRADRRLRRRRARRDAEADRVVAAAAGPGRAQGVVGARSRSGSARTACATTARAR